MRLIPGPSRATVWLAAIVCVVFGAHVRVAYAESPGSCPGADVVETNLQNGSSSGYFIPHLKLIVLNKRVLEGTAPVVQKFILAHECSHADPVVGDDEMDADCAAAKQGARDGWLGATEIIQVCVHLSHLVVDAEHAPAAYRCANIRRCVAIVKPPPPPKLPQIASGTPPDEITPLKRY